MKEKDLTYSDVARSMNRNPSTIRTWVDKDIVPAGDVLHELSNILDVSMEFLVTGTKTHELYSREEKKLIADFRTLEPPDKTEILFLIDLKKKKKTDPKTEYYPV